MMTDTGPGLDMRVVIVEDDAIYSETLQTILAAVPEVTIAGVFENGEDALTAIEDCSPQVLIADLGLPGMSGIDLIRNAKVLLPDLEVMVLTVFEDRETITAALKAGASSYMLKSSLSKDLVGGLFELQRGGAPMSPRIARKIVEEFQSDKVNEPYLLSHREKEIIGKIEAGLSYKEIAGDFGISTHTVHAHIRNIYKKLHAANKREALIKARQKGII